METALPPEILQEILTASPLSAFNTLARSCTLVRDLAASIAVRYADSMSVIDNADGDRARATLYKLPNGVHHGVSMVTIDRAEIVVNYDRGRIVGLCEAVRPHLGRMTFRPHGFVRLGARTSTAYSDASHLVLTRKAPNHYELSRRATYASVPNQPIECDEPPKWDIDSLEHHTQAEAWFARYMVQAPSHCRLLEPLCTWTSSWIKFVRKHLPGLFCVRNLNRPGR